MKAIRELLGRDPFISFQIVMNSGDRILIEDPTMFVVGKDEWMYGVPHSNEVIYMRPNQVAFVRVGAMLT